MLTRPNFGVCYAVGVCWVSIFKIPDSGFNNCKDVESPRALKDGSAASADPKKADRAILSNKDVDAGSSNPEDTSPASPDP